MTFYELEKRCKQRRFKRLLYIILSIVFIIIVIVVIFISSKKEVKTIKQVNNKIDLNIEDENILEIKNEKENKNQLEKNKNEKKILNNRVEYKKSNQIEKNNTKMPILTPIIPSLEKPKQKVENKIQIIKTPKPQNSIVEVDTLPSYKECIRLAKKYLREKKYDLALKWAKNANIQNKTLPDSWIITAKALFYSGKKEKAIEILKIYLKFQKNKEVENLLKKFENEKTH